jgi:integrase
MQFEHFRDVDVEEVSTIQEIPPTNRPDLGGGTRHKDPNAVAVEAVPSLGGPVTAGAQPVLASRTNPTGGHIGKSLTYGRNAETIRTATAIGRKRGPSLSRRIGQTGNVFQHEHAKDWNPAAPAYGRYWIDTPERRKRRTVALGICPSRSTAKRKLREHIEREGINGKEAFATNTAPATTFRVQATTWVASLATRRRKPVKPATIHGWQQALNKWLFPSLGAMPLSDVGNAALKGLIEKMASAGLSAQSIVNYTKVVKLVVASAVDAEGEQIHPRKWNHNFVGMPILNREEQHRPTVTEAEVGEILATANKRYRVLFALLAGTGLRIGEALGLKVEDVSEDCSVLHVKRSIWGGQEQVPKTPSALRVVDIADPLAKLLRGHLTGKSGYLFAAKSGRPLQQRNVLRALHATSKKVGFHAFRRFRAETLRRARVPEDLTKLWLGHSKQTVTDFYAGGLQKDEAWRREWCERAGLGFSLAGLLGLQNVVQIDSATAA